MNPPVASPRCGWERGCLRSVSDLRVIARFPPSPVSSGCASADDRRRHTIVSDLCCRCLRTSHTQRHRRLWWPTLRDHVSRSPLRTTRNFITPVSRRRRRPVDRSADAAPSASCWGLPAFCLRKIGRVFFVGRNRRQAVRRYRPCGDSWRAPEPGSHSTRLPGVWVKFSDWLGRIPPPPPRVGRRGWGWYLATGDRALFATGSSARLGDSRRRTKRLAQAAVQLLRLSRRHASRHTLTIWRPILGRMASQPATCIRL